MTVSPPIFRALSPVPMVTGKMGGAEASDSFSLASSETWGKVHGKGKTGRYAAVSAVGLGQQFEDFYSG